MSFKIVFFKTISFVLLFLSFSILSSAVQDYSRQEAIKVLKAIEKIENERSIKNKSSLREIVITESELNSYIAYRIEIQKEEAVKELHLKLFKGNKIEGKILIDLSGQKIPKFLRPRMNLYFSGKVEIKNDKVRLALKKLYLEEQAVRPMILDLIISIAARIENTEPSSMNDWYELPYGIKNIETDLGKAFFYY